MAIDRLINSSQGDSIISLLGGSGSISIADSLATIAAKSNTPYNTDNKLNTQYTTLTDYTKASAAQAIASSDNVPTALGKLEYKADTNTYDINTNKNNILSVANQSTQYNLLSYTLADLKSYNSGNASWNGNVCTVGNLVFTVNDDMSITVSGSQGIGSVYFTLAKNVSYPSIRFQGCPTGGGSSTYQLQAYYSSAPASSANDNGTGISVEAGTWSEICITIRANQIFSNQITFKPMAIPQSLYDAGFTDYQPYSLPNTTITPALQECVENGAKNLVNVPDITISASGGGYVTANNNVVLPAGKYVIIANATATSGNLLTSFKDSGGNTIGALELVMNGGQIKGTITLSVPSSYFNAFANQPTTVTKYMIIAQAMYNAGFTDYQPYAMNNADLTANMSLIAPFDTAPTQNSTKGMTSGALYTEFQKTLQKQSTLSTDDDFNSATLNGMYKFNGGPTNNPAVSTGAYGILLVFTFDNYIMQLCYDFVNGIYYRNKVSSWSAWTKFN